MRLKCFQGSWCLCPCGHSVGAVARDKDPAQPKATPAPSGFLVLRARTPPHADPQGQPPARLCHHRAGGPSEEVGVGRRIPLTTVRASVCMGMGQFLAPLPKECPAKRTPRGASRLLGLPHPGQELLHKKQPRAPGPGSFLCHPLPTFFDICPPRRTIMAVLSIGMSTRYH